MKLLTFLLLASCAVPQVVTPPPPLTQRQVLALGSASLLSLDVLDLENPDDGVGTGSGAAVGRVCGRQVVLTAGHLFTGVIRPLIRVETTEDGAPHWGVAGVLLAVDSAADLALVSLPVPTTSLELGLAPVEPEMFETLYMFGNPSGAPRTVGTSILAAKHRPSDSKHKRRGDMWQLTGFAWPGSSGGPVLDSRARLVSVILAVDQDRDDDGAVVIIPDVAFTAPWANVRDFLRKNGVTR